MKILEGIEDKANLWLYQELVSLTQMINQNNNFIHYASCLHE
jgi:hypothetical protein